MTAAKKANRSRGDGPRAAPGRAAQHEESLAVLEGRLGYGLDAALLVRALTHRSFAYENGGLPTNERLEFLGDSVLGLIVTDTLYRIHPDLPEGQLAKLRAAVVNARALAGVGRGLELGRFVRLGRGEEGTGGRDKSSILADTVEAVIGAVYLDQGLDAATELVHRLFDPLIEESAGLGAGLDWKTSLQELTAETGIGVPEYVITESGPDHEKHFAAVARVGGDDYGSGAGRSKKEAEQQAAESAWHAIRVKVGLDDDPAAGSAAGATASSAAPAATVPAPGAASAAPAVAHAGPAASDAAPAPDGGGAAETGDPESPGSGPAAGAAAS